MRVALLTDLAATDVVAQARQAEELGFDGVASGEHLFFHGPAGNAFITLAAAAGATTRVRLLATLAELPLYPPALAVKLATTLDQVSGGRFEFGVGLGGEYPAEFVAAGIPLSERGARVDETLELARRLWRGGPVRFDGRFVTIPDLELQPGPAQPGGPPIWVGGRRERALRRAARFADVWFPYMYTPEQLADSLGTVRAGAEGMGRDPATIRGAVLCWGAVHSDAREAVATAVDGVSEIYQQDFTRLASRYLLGGDPAAVVGRALEYADAGADWLVFAPVSAGREAGVRLFADEVLPALQGHRRALS